MTDGWDLTYEDDPWVKSDERLAYELLCGGDVRLPNKQVGKAYLAPGSKPERQARTALARLIRKGSPFPEFIRETFADMFDPESSTVPVDRRIEFKRLHAGELESRPEAKLEIAMHVWLRRKLGDKAGDAITSAMEQFGLERSRVYAICREHKNTLPKPSRLLSSRIG